MAVYECKACGYKAGEEYDYDEDRLTKYGDEEFIEIGGSFHVSKGDYYTPYIEKVKLYACPVCKTVILVD